MLCRNINEYLDDYVCFLFRRNNNNDEYIFTRWVARLNHVRGESYIIKFIGIDNARIYIFVAVIDLRDRRYTGKREKRDVLLLLFFLSNLEKKSSKNEILTSRLNVCFREKKHKMSTEHRFVVIIGIRIMFYSWDLDLADPRRRAAAVAEDTTKGKKQTAEEKKPGPRSVVN